MTTTALELQQSESVPCEYQVECNMPKELDYYALYLRKYLTDTMDERKDDEDFIDARAELAAQEYEDVRRSGATVDVAQESAMAILTSGL